MIDPIDALRDLARAGLESEDPATRMAALRDLAQRVLALPCIEQQVVGRSEGELTIRCALCRQEHMVNQEDGIWLAMQDGNHSS